MAQSNVQTGATTPTNLDEDTELYATTTAGAYFLRATLANLANGETLIVRVQTKVRSGDSYETEVEEEYAHDQGVPVIKTEVVSSPIATRFSIEQKGGTLRQIVWAVVKVAD